MTFSKNQNSLYESIVYRELERQAVKDGTFEPTAKEIVKSASVQTNKHNITGNFDVDVANLISALREKGFDKQADKIQGSYVSFKKAENGLYNLKNEDLLEFAHLGGDVEIAPSKDGHGKVETVQSAAKKIREIVSRGPKSKTASLKKKAQTDPVAQAEAAVQAAFNNINEIKNSLPQVVGNLDTVYLDLTKTDFKDPEILKMFTELSGTDASFVQRYFSIRAIIKTIPGASTSKTPAEATSAIKDGLYNNAAKASVFILAKLVGLDVANYNINPNAIIENPLTTLFNVQDSYKKLAADIYTSAEAISNNLKIDIKNVNDKIYSYYQNVNNALLALEIPPASAFINVSDVKYNELSAFLYNLKKRFVEIYSGDDNQSLMSVFSLTDQEKNKSLIDFWTAVSGVVDEALATVPPEGSPMREVVPDFSGKLDPAIEFWKEKYDSYEEGTEDRRNAGLNLSTISRLKNGLEPFVGKPFITLKVGLLGINETLPKELPPQPLDQIDSVAEMNQYLSLILAESQPKTASAAQGLTKKAGLLLPTSDTGKGKGKPQEAGRPSAPRSSHPAPASVAGRPTTEEEKAVVSMQRLLGKFSQGLNEKTEEISKKTNMTPEELKSLALTIGFTNQSGAKGQGSYDGKWGQNTSAALKAAKSIAEKLGKGSEVVDSGISYTKRDPKAVEQDAKKNIEGLISVMKDTNLSPYLGEYNVELDYIPKNKEAWTDENADPLAFNNPQEGFVVMPEHVKSIRDFFALVSSVNKTASSKDFAKLAQQVQDASIIRQNPYGEGSQMPAGSMTYNDFTNALNWFYNRSNLVYRTALSRQQAGEPNPLTGKAYTNREIAIARSYHQQMQRLAAEWKNNYDNFFKDKGYVSQNDFLKAERGGVNEPAAQEAGRPSKDKERIQRSPGGYSVNVGGGSSENPLEEPPLSDFINIRHLADKYNVKAEDIQWFEQNVKTAVIDRMEWKRSYVSNIVHKYSKKPLTQIENYNFMEDFETHASNIVNDVFADWEEMIEEYLDDKRVQRVYRKQNRERDRWLETFSSKTDEARKLMGK